MTDQTQLDHVSEPHAAPRDWVRPEVVRFVAGDAEAVGASGDDGVIGTS